MKKHRPTPLGDLFPSPLKAESKPTDKFMKNNSSGNGNLKVKCSSINTAAVPNLCVSTLKSPVRSNKEIVDSFISNPDSVKTPSISEYREVPKTVHTSQTAIRDTEEDDAMLMSIDSVGSSIKDGKCSVEARNCSVESSMGTLNFSGRSDPSKARDEKDGDAPQNVVSSLNDVGLSNGSAPTPDCVNRSHGGAHQCDVPTTNMHESSSHVQTKIDNGLGELVDVRVCDICGDVGREALLALCSKCSDGAEHIYCMRVKMDTVPKCDWVCEDCMMMQDLKRQLKPLYLKEAGKKRSSDVEVRSPSKRRILEGNVRPLKLSGSCGIPSLTRATSLKIMDERNESTTRIYSYDDLSCKKVMDKASPKPSVKDRTLWKNVQPLKSYGSARKTLLTQVSSLKIDKRKVAVWKSTCIDNQAAKEMEEKCLSPSFRSVKSQHIHGGYEEPGKGKLFKRSTSSVGVRRPYKDDVKSERNNLRESKKLVKSVSFSGVRTALNTPTSHFPHASNVKGLKCWGGEKSREKYGSSENRSLRGVIPTPRSGAMRVNSCRTTLGSDIIKTQRTSRNNVQNNATKANTLRTTSECEISKVPCSSRGNVESMKAVNDNSNANTFGEEIGSPKNANPDANHSSPLKIEPECFSRVDNELPIRKVDSHPNKEFPVPLASSVITAVPGSECIWRGAFELEHGCKLPKECGGIQAHLSTCASSNVVELVHKFRPKILVKQVARLEVWPNRFERNYPTEKDVAIYFFAQDFESYLSSYKGLLDGMMENDLALEANLDAFQFLVFPSSLLPAGSQRWNTLFFLWGVFRVRTIDNYSLQDPCLNTVSMKQGVESFDPMALQCPESTNTRDRGGENEVSLKEKCFPSRETLLCEPVMVEVAEKKCFSDGVPCSDDFQKEDGHINLLSGYLSNTHIFPYDKSEKDNQVLLSLETANNGFRNDKHPLSSFAWAEKRLDVASWSSISVDSGPSGSSDGGGCAKSDEGQVEQLHDPSNCRALNLDLCLGSGWDPQGQVDLDLVLGLSRTSKCEPDHRPKGISYDKGDISLALSLGMPYSNG